MKILFIHGLASSGAYKTADTLRILLRPCEVLAPDVPIEPDQALPMLQMLCATEQPDLIVGLSLGAFWAQKLRGYKKICLNPDLHVSVLLGTLLGEQPYLSPRQDGATTFVITPEICEGYRRLEAQQFEGLDAVERNVTVGLFADADEIVHCHDEFALHYPNTTHWYPGKHLPTFPELKKYLLPCAARLLEGV